MALLARFLFRFRWVIGISAACLAIVLTSGFLAVRFGLHHRLYRALFYPVVAQRAAGSATSQDATVVALEQFVYENVRTPGRPPVVDDSAADVLQRGYGYCDQASWVFARLAQERGIPSRLLFLYDSNGISPHTVAEVYLSGHWRVVDVLYGLIPRRPDGQIATVADLLADPGLLKDSRVKLDWYRRAQPVPLVPADATIAGGAIEWLGEAASRLPAPVLDRVQDAYLALPPPRYVDTQGNLVEDFHTPASRLYRAARNEQVFGRTSTALAAYQELQQRYPTSPYASDALYQQGLVDLTQRRQPERSASVLGTFFREYPRSPWTLDALFFAGQAAQRSGNCRTAATDLGRVAASSANGEEVAGLLLQSLPCR